MEGPRREESREFLVCVRWRRGGREGRREGKGRKEVRAALEVCGASTLKGFKFTGVEAWRV